MAEQTQKDLLLITLEIAVPLWIERWKDQPWEAKQARAKECSEVIAHQADQILFLTKASKANVGTAVAFNRLAETLAILSFCPGGVSFHGRRWETESEV